MTLELVRPEATPWLYPDRLFSNPYLEKVLGP
ncbi:hypothetical protein ABIB15_001661 [Marisediminicola sp. UYEF4]